MWAARTGTRPTRRTRHQLPATISSLHYELPRDHNDNCLGGIGYEATDSGADLSLKLRRKSSCFDNVLEARITDMPSLGIDARLDRDGSGQFSTYLGSDGQPQQLGHLELKAPIPSGLAAKFNQPTDLPETEFCPQVGALAGAKKICITAELSAKNISYSDLYLRVTPTG